MPMIDLQQGDCLELLKNIADGSVDMVLTDPPYGITACKWDKVIPFDEMWAQLKRITKKNGAIVLFGSELFGSRLRLSNFKDYRYDFYWVKNRATGFGNAKNRPLKNIELISVFSGGTTAHKAQSKNRMTYNPQGLAKIDKMVKSSKRKHETIFDIKRPSYKPEYYQEFTNYPAMVIKFNGEQGFHPTQKPVPLLEYLIKTYTHEGETVLDFTMGSGSTGVACVNTGRKFIGIELDGEYFATAQKRISQAVEETK